MDIYHSLDLAVPQLLFTVLYHAGPTVSEEAVTRSVTALMEHIAGQTSLEHASFWQRKLGLGTGKEFVLRLRLPLT